MFILRLCLLTTLILESYHCANVLVLEGTPSPSHHVWMRTLMIALAERGHNVTSISPDIDKEQTPNLHYIHLENAYRHLYNGTNIDFVYAGEINSISAIFFYAQYCLKSCEGVLTSNGIQTLLNYPSDYKFDVVIHENLLSPCLIGFLHRFGYPALIHATPFHMPALSAQWVGQQFNSYAKPYFRTGDDETFIGRVENYSLYMIEYFVRRYFMFPKMNALSKRIFSGAPTISELEKNVKLVLINSHPISEIVEPLLPNVIPVGGLQVHTPGKLSADLKTIADSATNGLVLLSLGTNARSDTLGLDRLTYIVEAFRSFPSYTFLWKFESDKVPIEVPPNVHIIPWIQQTEVLAHTNTILFMTHSGLFSTQEAIWYGIPMLCLPVFADQTVNSFVVKRAGAAESLPVNKINSTNLRDIMAHIFSNLSEYRSKVGKMSKSFRDQPELPLERAIWWIEWLLRNPDVEYLNTPAKDLNVFSRNSIDVIVFLGTLLFITLYVLVKTGYLIIKIVMKPIHHNKLKKHYFYAFLTLNMFMTFNCIS